MFAFFVTFCETKQLSDLWNLFGSECPGSLSVQVAAVSATFLGHGRSVRGLLKAKNNGEHFLITKVQEYNQNQ